MNIVILFATQNILPEVLPMDLLRFLAFVTIALIVPTLGIRSGDYCSSLYTETNLAGGFFNVPYNSDFANLQEEYLTRESVWNITKSFHVGQGCILKACSEPYYAGNCTEFNHTANQLPQNLQNILSASCSCREACKCSNYYKMKKSSCVRFYLLSGGCNVCNPPYLEFPPGDEYSFPEDGYETNVTSILVRHGCRLITYDEDEFEGSQHSVEGIVQNWNVPVRSYDCTCSAEKNLTSEAVSPNRNYYPPMLDIPKSFVQMQQVMSRGNESQPRLRAAVQSHLAKRSSKNAYILLLGSVGSGKSSTMKTLFGQNVYDDYGFDSRRRNRRWSGSRRINERRVPIYVDELGIGNSQLRVIEVPGLSSTQGLDHNALTLATLDEYLTRHEELRNTIPNVVLIFHKFMDNRFAGQGSSFVKMIRGFELLRDKITDENYSNIIFVFSHFLSEIKSNFRNPRRKLNALKNTIQEFTGFPQPILTAFAENRASENGAYMVNGSFKLPNGEYYPKNLFNKIIQMTRIGRDPIGEAIIRSAFYDSDSLNATSIDFPMVERNSSNFRKYLDPLTECFTSQNSELIEKLKAADNSMDEGLKAEFPEELYYVQKSLDAKNYRTEADIPRTTTKIVQLFTELRQNQAVYFLLKKAFDLSPPVLPEIGPIGKSYNLFKDRPLAVSPFNMGELKNSRIGYRIPSILNCNVDYEKVDIFKFHQNREDYIMDRLQSLNITRWNNTFDSFSGVLKPGHNILDQTTTPDVNLSKPITAVQEFRTFQLVLNDKYTLTKSFKQTVLRLKPFVASDYQSVDRWKSFFNEYGTHVVQSVYGGGAIEIEVKTNTTFPTQTAPDYLSFAQFPEDLALGKTVSSNIGQEGIRHSLSFTGGDVKYHTTDLTKMPLQDAANLLKDWKNSLRFSPIILRNEMRLVPISEIAKVLGLYYSSQIERATRLLLNSELVYNPNREPNYWQWY